MPAEASLAAVRGPAVDVAAVRGRRRPWLIATGLLLASVGALLVMWLVGSAGQRQDVLVVRQAVEYGEVIESADLGIARVSIDPGVEVVPASDRVLIEGKVATTRLTPGMLLAPGVAEPGGAPSPGQVLVPIAVPADRMPAGGLRAGDRILAVDSEPSDGLASSASIPAEVVRIGPMDVNGVTVVDVAAKAPDGPVLAVAAANGRVALVVVPVGN